MQRTEKFRDTHRELVQIVGEISKLLKVDELGKDASAVRSLLSQLAAKLNMHLAMEDKALYPELLRHKDPGVQAKAKAFVAQMGGIKEAFVGYLARYPSVQAIQASPQKFIQETQQVFQVLADRIQAEDNDLHPLVDRLWRLNANVGPCEPE